jgi:hypothetical protein
MKRRLFLAGVLISTTGVCKQALSNSGKAKMLDEVPEKIRLIPDDWHVQHVGHLADGRLFWVTGQLDPAGGTTKDFVCTFVFDQDGHLTEHSIRIDWG